MYLKVKLDKFKSGSGNNKIVNIEDVPGYY
jgi:hypothetical protein